MDEKFVEHHVVWHSSQLASSEYGTLLEDEDGYRLQGITVLPLQGRPCHIEYQVVLDRHWVTRHGIAIVTTPASVKTIDVSYVEGHWELNGEETPSLEGCTDLDLGWTPATNTIPIRRLALKMGQSATVTAACVRFPELDVVATRQTYTRLAFDRWRYEAGEYDDFDIETDSSTGLVVAYGDGLWKASGSMAHLS